MTHFSRTVTKLTRCVYSVAAHKPTQNTRCFSSLIRNIIGSSTVRTNCLNTGSKQVPCSVGNSCHSGQLHSDGDKDFVNFLNDEISFEKKNIKDIPKVKNFDISMNGTVVTLRRNFEGEKIEAIFNCNDNANVDGDKSNTEHNNVNMYTEEDEREDTSDILSYPTFTVTIAKPSGETLVFKCNCNSGIDENNMDEDEDDDQCDLLRIDNVQIYNAGSVDQEKVYRVQCDDMDPELYVMLMNTLHGRGINGEFVDDLIDVSKSVEHRHYFTFLRSLKNFMKEC